MAVLFERARWIESLSTYDFAVEYRPGNRHGNADGMPRCPNPQQCACRAEPSLNCGPCSKCVRRSASMQISLSPLVESVRHAEVATSGLAEGTLAFG